MATGLRVSSIRQDSDLKQVIYLPTPDMHAPMLYDLCNIAFDQLGSDKLLVALYCLVKLE